VQGKYLYHDETTSKKSMKMKKEITIALSVYILCVGLASVLWHYQEILALCYLIISVYMLYRWHTKSDVIFYSIAFVFGPAGEVVAVSFRAWEYSKPLYVIPIWLPFLWGIAALFIKKLSEILLSKD
jgi:hypothetical protein